MHTKGGPKSAPNRRAAGSVLGGAAAVAGSFAAVGFTDEFVVGALAVVALDALPPIVFGYGIQWLGSLAKPLLVVTTTLVAVGVLAAAVEAGHRIADRWSTAVGGAVVFAGLAALTTVTTGSLSSGLGAGVAGTLAFVVAETGGAEDRSAVRRRLLRSIGVLVGTLGVGGLFAVRRTESEPSSARMLESGGGLDDGRIADLLTIADERSFDLPDVDHLVSDEFYRVDINVTSPPSVDPDDWSLRIHGAVDRELEFDYAEVTARPTEHRFVTLRCVSDFPNGRRMDTALWTGTPLRPVLDAAGAGGNCCVRLEAADGYYQAFPREALERGFLAWGMDGEPLPENHGAPVRVLIPGHWGEINVKWLESIEVRAEPATGYWEKRGWHGTGPVETVAKFHSRERDGDRVTIGGHAYAGIRGISRVDVSTDGGETWTEAELSEPLPAATPAGGSIASESRANDAWRMWKHEYENPERHDVTVRAYERDGSRQPKADSDPFPSGATGWVTHTMYGKRE